jgi:hypothetical protein
MFLFAMVTCLLHVFTSFLEEVGIGSVRRGATPVVAPATVECRLQFHLHYVQNCSITTSWKRWHLSSAPNQKTFEGGLPFIGVSERF